MAIPVEQAMGSIVPMITTPLALAALALLVISGILKVAVPKARRQDFRLLIIWSFVLAIVLGVLADISFLVVSSFNREVRIAGTVLDNTGKALSMAVVDIPGCGRGITDDYGAFEFSIPDSRTKSSYDVITHLDGYATDHQALPGPRPQKYLNISLKQPVLTADALIQVPTQCGVAHYLGLPQVDLWLTFYNPFPRPIALNNISLSIIEPNGSVIVLPMQGVYQPGTNVLTPAFTILQLEKSQTFPIGYSFFDQYDFPATQVLLQEAQIQFPGTGSLPQSGQIIYSDSLVKKFTDFMNLRWFWLAGEWQLSISCQAEGVTYTRKFKFNLTDQDTNRMKAISRYYQSGYGILTAFRLWQLPDASSYIMVHPTP
jgi:hypothetical protein